MIEILILSRDPIIVEIQPLLRAVRAGLSAELISERLHATGVSRDKSSRNTASHATAVKAFELIGNETRAQILSALGGVRDSEEGPPALSFSALRSAVETDIDSSQFNYHLQQLVDTYLRQTDEGYQMRPAGMLLYRTMRAGTITQELTLSPLDVGVDCYRCGGAVIADPEYGEFWIRCSDCDHFYDMVMAPPGTVGEGDTAELLGRLDQHNRQKRMALIRGICPICMNHVSQRITRLDEYPYTETELIDYHVHWWCDHCGNRMFAPVGMTVVDYPEVLSFFDSRGVDLTNRIVWDCEFAMTDRTLTVRSMEPWEFSLVVAHGDSKLELVLDDELSVVETMSERSQQ